jgi:hypothetical protein
MLIYLAPLNSSSSSPLSSSSHLTYIWRKILTLRDHELQWRQNWENILRAQVGSDTKCANGHIEARPAVRLRSALGSIRSNVDMQVIRVL